MSYYTNLNCVNEVEIADLMTKVKPIYQPRISKSTETSSFDRDFSIDIHSKQDELV